MAESVSVKHNLASLNAALDGLEAKAMNMRPAAQAGAQVFYDEVKLNASRIKKQTGNLADSIYQVYSKDSSSEQLATYHVSWNHQEAPHGHLVEFGHIQTRKAYVGSDGKWYTSKALLDQPRQIGARPFVRPAYDAKLQQALEAASKRWLEDASEAL